MTYYVPSGTLNPTHSLLCEEPLEIGVSFTDEITLKTEHTISHSVDMLVVEW